MNEKISKRKYFLYMKNEALSSFQALITLDYKLVNMIILWLSLTEQSFWNYQTLILSCLAIKIQGTCGNLYRKINLLLIVFMLTCTSFCVCIMMHNLCPFIIQFNLRLFLTIYKFSLSFITFQNWGKFSANIFHSFTNMKVKDMHSHKINFSLTIHK